MEKQEEEVFVGWRCTIFWGRGVKLTEKDHKMSHLSIKHDASHKKKTAPPYEVGS